LISLAMPQLGINIAVHALPPTRVGHPCTWDTPSALATWNNCGAHVRPISQGGNPVPLQTQNHHGTGAWW
jgi:hypothetical protein